MWNYHLIMKVSHGVSTLCMRLTCNKLNTSPRAVKYRPNKGILQCQRTTIALSALTHKIRSSNEVGLFSIVLVKLQLQQWKHPCLLHSGSFIFPHPGKWESANDGWRRWDIDTQDNFTVWRTFFYIARVTYLSLPESLDPRKLLTPLGGWMLRGRVSIGHDLWNIPRQELQRNWIEVWRDPGCWLHMRSAGGVGWGGGARRRGRVGLTYVVINASPRFSFCCVGSQF